MGAGSLFGRWSREAQVSEKGKRNMGWGFPGGPVVRTPCSQCRGAQVPSLVDPACHRVRKKKNKPQNKTKKGTWDGDTPVNRAFTGQRGRMYLDGREMRECRLTLLYVYL